MQEIAVVLPIFNDWHSFVRLIPDLESAFAGTGVDVTVVAVDDGSVDPLELGDADWSDYQSVKRIEILQLASNVGHQRAIAIGLSYVQKNLQCDAAIVMDSDGEDRPRDIPKLLDAHTKHSASIIAAARATRSEGAIFKLYYGAYKICFRLLTGRVIDFGNFCLIPRQYLGRITHQADLWNHLAACIIRSRLPLVRVPTDRGRRYAGQSHMNLVSLIVHGLSAMSVFSDAVFVRLILAAFALAGITISASVAILAIRLGTDWTPPGWASIVLVSLGVILLQALVLSVGTTFLHLHGRSSPSVLPAQMAEAYVLERIVLPNAES